MIVYLMLRWTGQTRIRLLNITRHEQDKGMNAHYFDAVGHPARRFSSLGQIANVLPFNNVTSASLR